MNGPRPTETGAPQHDGKPPRARGRKAPLRRLTRHLLAVRTVLNVLLVLAVLYTLVLAHSLIIPLVLAAFIALGLNPLVKLASRWHVPRTVSVLLLMAALGVGIGAGITSLAPPAAHWLKDAPTALRHIEHKIKPVTSRINAAANASSSLAGGQHGARGSGGATAHTATFSVWDLLKITPRILGDLFVVTLLVFFFLLFGDALLRRLVEISPTLSKKRFSVVIVRNIQAQVSHYLLVRTLINLGLGGVTAAWLWLMGVDDPVLWAVLVVLADYIPYVGAVAMALLLAVVGLIQFHFSLMGLLPAAGFAVLAIVEGNIVTPLVFGQSMRLSPVAILVWLLIWGWMWGIAGALLAVPMLTIFKVITGEMPGWRWFSQIVER